MEPAKGSDEHISAITAAVMKVKTHVTMKLVLFVPLETFLCEGWWLYQ